MEKQQQFKGPMGQIVINTDMQTLGFVNANRSIEKMKKLPTYKYYNEMIDNYLVLHPLMAKNMDSKQYMAHLKKQQFTPYNIPLEEVLCLAFTGFVHLYHYVSSNFGSFNLFQLHHDVLCQFKTTANMNQLQGDYSFAIRTFFRSSHLGVSYNGGQIPDYLNQLFEQSYIKDTSELADRLVSPLVDEYYNKSPQQLKSILSFFDIISKNHDVWQFYYDNIIKKYSQFNGKNYLSNFGDYTFERFEKTWSKITGKQIQNDGLQTTQMESSDDSSISPSMSLSEISSDTAPAIQNKDEISIDLTDIDVDIVKEEEVKSSSFPSPRPNAPLDLPEEWVSAESSASQDEEQVTSSMGIMVRIKGDTDYGHQFGNKMHVETDSANDRYSFRGGYTYSIYIDCDFKARIGFFEGPALIYIYKRNITIYGKNYISHHHMGRCFSFTMYDYVREKKKKPVVLRYLKFKAREKFDPANILYSNGLGTLGIQMEILQNAINNEDAMNDLEIFNELNHDVVF